LSTNAVLRTDIERALDEIVSQEEGMRFQGLAVTLGKMRWPELVARQRKKDQGLDAYAAPGFTIDNNGRGLAASITPTLKKVSDDVTTAKKHFPELRQLLFVTCAKVGNADRRDWEESILKDHKVELQLIEREEIITLLLMPANRPLLPTFLGIADSTDPLAHNTLDRIRRAASQFSAGWGQKLQGQPLIELTAAEMRPDDEDDSGDTYSLADLRTALSLGRRLVLEAPAGRGKTTTLIQLSRTEGRTINFLIGLPSWCRSNQGILDFIVGSPAFRAEGISASELARAQAHVPFVFLLNGWNEIGATQTQSADDALQQLDRDFPSAGILVATRTHHLTPPIPSAARLRLRRLRRRQRAKYLAERFGPSAAALRTRIDSDPMLDELTRTPFVLAEVAALYADGATIPNTRLAILKEVLRLQEHRTEHRNALLDVPVQGLQTTYLKALAIYMTVSGAASIAEPDALNVVAGVVQQLAKNGQIAHVGAHQVISTLVAHHVLERVEHPAVAFQFEHQQLQEYYACLDVRDRLFALASDSASEQVFTTDLINQTTWAEPLRMIAESLSGHGADDPSTRAGARLVEMTSRVDLIFAAELSHKCGPAVWRTVRSLLAGKLRACLASHGGVFRDYSIAAMMATGSSEFSDVLGPIFASTNQGDRLHALRLWQDLHLSSVAEDWQAEVSGWSAEARADLVGEVLDHRFDEAVLAFAVNDPDGHVQEAAAEALSWNGWDDALLPLLNKMDDAAFSRFARHGIAELPELQRSRALSLLRDRLAIEADPSRRLATAMRLIEAGESSLTNCVKNSMNDIVKGDLRQTGVHFLEPALKFLKEADPDWASAWLSERIADGTFYNHEYWLPQIKAIPRSLVLSAIEQLGSRDFLNRPYRGLAAVIGGGASAEEGLALFARIRAIRDEIRINPKSRVDNQLRWRLHRQLSDAFRLLAPDVQAQSVLAGAPAGDVSAGEVAVDLLSRMARHDQPVLRPSPEWRDKLREYLLSLEKPILEEDDFSGELKVDLASALSQVGREEDQPVLERLIDADISRRRRGLEAIKKGDQASELVNGGRTNQSGWHLSALYCLTPEPSAALLIRLLAEPEYLSEVCTALRRELQPSEPLRVRAQFPIERLWVARENPAARTFSSARETQLLDVLRSHLESQLRRSESGEKPVGSLEMAGALAVIDPIGASKDILAAVRMPAPWAGYYRLAIVENLLLAGVSVPVELLCDLVDAAHADNRWLQDSDRTLLLNTLRACVFSDNPTVGIEKIRSILALREFWGYELRDVITALGKSRSEAAVPLLEEFAKRGHTYEQCAEEFLTALSTLGTPRSQQLLSGLVDPTVEGLPKIKLSRPEVVVSLLIDLQRRNPAIRARFEHLSVGEVPPRSRALLSAALCGAGDERAIECALHLMDDTAEKGRIPPGLWDLARAAFLGEKPHGALAGSYEIQPRAANSLRRRLFQMAVSDRQRRGCAIRLLAEIETYRLERGWPHDEPRHPSIESGHSWPLVEGTRVSLQ
jgi:hypothetical protein